VDYHEKLSSAAKAVVDTASGVYSDISAGKVPALVEEWKETLSQVDISSIYSASQKGKPS
jgi:hypothetical protein